MFRSVSFYLSNMLFLYLFSFFRTIFVHGYAVDGEGMKMSKSLGNVVNPQDILYGGKDLKKQPTYGVDTLRLGLPFSSRYIERI